MERIDEQEENSSQQSEQSIDKHQTTKVFHETIELINIVTHASSPMEKFYYLDVIFAKLSYDMDQDADSMQRLMLFCMLNIEKRPASLYIDYLFVNTFAPEVIKMNEKFPLMVHILSALSILNTELDLREFDTIINNYQSSYKFSSMGFSQRSNPGRKLTEDEKTPKLPKNCIISREQLPESIWDGSENQQ